MLSNPTARPHAVDPTVGIFAELQRRAAAERGQTSRIPMLPQPGTMNPGEAPPSPIPAAPAPQAVIPAAPAPQAMAAPEIPAAPVAPVEKPSGGGGIFDRIGSFIGSDEGRAILMRAAGGAAEGGLGGAIRAGTTAADERRAADEQQARFEDELKQTVLGRQSNDEYREGVLEDRTLGRMIDTERLAVDAEDRRGRRENTRAGIMERSERGTANRRSRERVAAANIASRENISRLAREARVAMQNNDHIQAARLLGMRARMQMESGNFTEEIERDEFGDVESRTRRRGSE